MKKNTLKSFLAVLAMGILSQGPLQAMDQAAPAQIEDHSNNSCLAPFLRGLNRLAGRELVAITPKIQEPAQSHTPEVHQRTQDHSANSCVINACNDMSAIASNASGSIASLPTSIINQFREYQRRRNALNRQQIDLYFGLLSCATISYITATQAYSSATFPATTQLSFASGVVSLGLAHQALRIAESYHPERSVPARQRDAQITPPSLSANDIEAFLNRTAITVDEPRECSVCLSEVVQGEQAVKLPRCAHIYHRDCISQWIIQQARDQQEPNCPTCREIIAVNTVN